MCEHCSNIVLKKSFSSPADYKNTIQHIINLINSGYYQLIYATCPLDGITGADGAFIEDVICHSIKCKICSSVYTSVCDTYRGGGNFENQG